MSKTNEETPASPQLEWEKQTALDRWFMNIVRGDDTEAVTAALDSGANPNAADYKDFMITPLLVAALRGNALMVRLLLDRGADINGRDAFERTALIAAATEGHTVVVQLLLERGADRHAVARELDFGHPTGTAHDEAVRHGHTEIANLLQAAAGAAE